MGALVQAIQRAFNAMPAASKAKALAWLSTATKGVVTSVRQAIDYAKKNPMLASLVVEALVRNGADVMDLTSSMPKDENSASFEESLLRLAADVASKEDSQNTGLAASAPDTARDKLRQQMGRQLVRQFGSLEAARAVQIAFGTLTEADYNWLREVGLGRG